MGEAEAIAAAPASPRKPPGMFSYLLLTAVFLVVIYVLALGPAVNYYWAHQGTAAAQAIRTIYYPVERLCMISPPVENLLHRYVRLWVRDN